MTFRKRLVKIAEQAQSLGEQALVEELGKHIRYSESKRIDRIFYKHVIYEAVDYLTNYPRFRVDRIIMLIVFNWDRGNGRFIETVSRP